VDLGKKMDIFLQQKDGIVHHLFIFYIYVCVENCAPSFILGLRHNKLIEFWKHSLKDIGNVTQRPFLEMQVFILLLFFFPILFINILCNPNLNELDIVYAVVYSLLLLNTDLHVAQGNYTRMTRQAFVRNTMSTIQDQNPSEKVNNFSPAWESNVESLLKV
jgi:hypothetical protein